MISSMWKFGLFLGTLALAGCALGTGDDSTEGSASSALGSGDDSAHAGDGTIADDKDPTLHPELPRTAPQYSVIPVEQMASPPPSPWRGGDKGPR